MLHKRLKQARLHTDLTQEELGERVGAAKATISNYENKHSTPSNEILVKLADVLGVSTDFLLGRDVGSGHCLNIREKIINELEKYPQMYQDLIYDPEKNVEILYRLYQIKIELTKDTLKD